MLSEIDVTVTGPEELTDSEIERIVLERDASFEEDKKTAVDARAALEKIRANLQSMSPR